MTAVEQSSDPLVRYCGELVPLSVRDRIEELVAQAPDPSDATLNRIAQLLRPTPGRAGP